MPDSKYAKYMDMVVEEVTTFLKPLNFKKRRHTFNRWTPDGLCHVFNLQMGQKPFGPPKPMLIYRDLYGKFTANLGIFVPEIHEQKNPLGISKKTPDFINEYQCSLRARFHELAKDRRELWWDLAADPHPNAQGIIELLQLSGMPFLDRFSSRRQIVEHLVSFNETVPVTNRPKLDIAIILEHLGQHEQATDMFNQHYKQSIERPSPVQGHISYLESIAEERNWTISFNNP